MSEAAQSDHEPDYEHDDIAREQRDIVLGMNEFADGFHVTGAAPPIWFRLFRGRFDYHGRWYARGGPDAYQNFRADRRLAALKINGEKIAELDIRASSLTILHGLLGKKLPKGDPYEVGGFPREVVKAWIISAIKYRGKVKKWPRYMVMLSKRRGRHTNAPVISKFCPVAVGKAVVQAYPFMGKLREITLPGDAPEGTPDVLLDYLNGLESMALTRAMLTLKEQNILALPLHDALLVAVSTVPAARTAFRLAFEAVAAIEPKIIVEWPTAEAEKAKP